MLQTGMRGLGWAIAQSGIVVFALAIGLAEGAIGQIVPDDTLGAEQSQVTAAGDRIEGGAQRGQNLFHSFREFNVGTGQQVYFANPADVRNIFSRVTGTNVSNIDGVLGVDGSANLFLMNPNGIVFGQNARLDVGGSFVGTTANAMGFGDRGWFSATSPEIPSQLLTIEPSAFWFDRVPTGSISSSSVAASPLFSGVFGLQVPTGQTLTLLGGNVQIDGSGVGAGLHAFSGRVEIGAVAGAGAVERNVDGSLSFPMNLARANVTFTNTALVDVAFDTGGSIGVTARNLDVLAGSKLLTGIGSEFGSVGSQAGDLILNATGSVTVSQSRVGNIIDRNAIGNGGNLFITAGQLRISDNAAIRVATLSSGNAGNLSLITENLTVDSGGTIVNSTFGTGNAGNSIIQSSESINLNGASAGDSPTGIYTGVQPGVTGSGGNLLIETRRLSVVDGAQVSSTTFGAGNAGDLTVRASEAINLSGSTGLFAGAAERSTGSGGNLLIETGQLSVVDGGQIRTSTFGTGDAGNLAIRASNSINLNGVNANGNPTGLSTGVAHGAIGDGGNLSIATRSLTVTNGGQISASTFGAGNAGDLTIQASEAINLSASSPSIYQTGLFADVETGSTGSGGDLLIGTGTLNATNGVRVSTSTSGARSAGDLTIQIEHLSISNGAQILTSTSGAGNAGNLIIQASRAINLRGSDTGLFTEASTGATGAGGDLTIRARGVVISNGAGVGLDTNGRGNAGDLTINARNIIVKSGQVTTSTDGAGNAGSMVIRASNLVDLSGEFSNTRNGAGSPGGLLAQVDALTATGQGGNLTLDTRRLRISDGSKVQVTTFGQGTAGTLRIRADAIDVLDTSRPNLYSTGIFAGTGKDPIVNQEIPERGNGGRLIINTNRLSIRGGEVSSDTRGLGNAGTARIRSRDLIEVIDPVAASGRRSFLSARVVEGARGNAGNLIVNTRRLVVRGGQVTASSSGRGQAGNLIIHATDSIDLSGVSPRRVQISAVDGRTVLPEQLGTVSAQVDRTGTKPGGNLTIQTDRLSVSDRAQISVSNQGTARAGDLSINARLVQLGDRAQLSAETRNANGGNITLNANDALLMNDRSSITTNAGTARAGGNGGNIVLNAGFVIAVPNTANQISANAFKGNGGQVNITTQGIYGFNDTAQSNPNTITATSNSGIQGTVTLNTPNVDPSRGLTELPTAPIDTTTQLSQVCPTNTQQADRLDSFIISRRGGLPPNPTDLLSTDNILTEWVTPGESGNANVKATSPPETQAIVEAQGLGYDSQGKVILVAPAPVVTPTHCP